MEQIRDKIPVQEGFSWVSSSVSAVVTGTVRGHLSAHGGQMLFQSCFLHSVVAGKRKEAAESSSAASIKKTGGFFYYCSLLAGLYTRTGKVFGQIEPI